MKYFLMVLALAFGASAISAAETPAAGQTEEVQVIDIGSIEVTVGDSGVLSVPVPHNGSMGDATYGGFKVVKIDGPNEVLDAEGNDLDVYQVELQADKAGEYDVKVDIKNEHGEVVLKLLGHVNILPK